MTELAELIDLTELTDLALTNLAQVQLKIAEIKKTIRC